jgi:hypothetical protein
MKWIVQAYLARRLEQRGEKFEREREGEREKTAKPLLSITGGMWQEFHALATSKEKEMRAQREGTWI